MIELFLFESDRRMMDMRSHLLVKDIFDVMGPIGIMYGGPFDGLDKGIDSVFVFEVEEFIDIFFKRLMSGGQTFQIDFGLFTEADKGLHLCRSPHPPLLPEGRFPVGRQLDTLPVFVGAGVCSDNFIPEIDG
jgi:hypothetical protein